MSLRLLAALVLLGLVVLFALQNAAPAEINLLLWQLVFPRYLLILIMLLIGIVIGWFLHAVVAPLRRRTRHERHAPSPPPRAP